MTRKRTSPSPNSKKDLNSTLLSIGVSLVLVTFSIFVILDTIASVTEAYKKRNIVKGEEDKVEDLRLENLEKQQELSYVLSDEYVEHEARAQFSYLKNGEKLFVLPDSVGEGEVSGVSDTTVSKTHKTPLEEWIQLLFLD